MADRLHVKAIAVSLPTSRHATVSMAVAQETAISPDTEATDHHPTAALQEATAHTATIQAVVLQAVLHAPTLTQAAQVLALAQDHQAAAVASEVHAAVAAEASVTEEEDNFKIKRLRN